MKIETVKSILNLIRIEFDDNRLEGLRILKFAFDFVNTIDSIVLKRQEEKEEIDDLVDDFIEDIISDLYSESNEKSYSKYKREIIKNLKIELCI